MLPVERSFSARALEACMSGAVYCRGSNPSTVPAPIISITNASPESPGIDRARPVYIQIDPAETSAEDPGRPATPQGLTATRSMGDVVPTENAIREIPVDIPVQMSPQEARAISILRNAGILMLRDGASVLVTTAAREAARFGAFAPAIDAVGPALAYGGAAVSLGMPVLLHLAGLVQDIRTGQANAANVASRIALVSIVAGGGIAMLVTGAATSAAPALLAASLVYCAGRDLVQYHLPLTDNLVGRSAPVHAVAAVLYALNQTGVGVAMDYFTDALTATLGSIGAAVLIKAMVNYLGELVCDATDLLAQQAANGTTDNAPLRLDLHVRRGGGPGYVAGMGAMATNTLAARMSLFGGGYAAAFAAASNPVLLGGSANAALNAITGAVIGSGYLPFIYTHHKRVPDGEVTPGATPGPSLDRAPSTMSLEGESVGDPELLEVIVTRL